MIAKSLISLTLLCAPTAFAHWTPATGCEPQLSEKPKTNSPFEIRISERVPGEAQKYEDYINHISKPDGLLDKLGIKMTGQIIEFLPGRDLNAVTSGSSGGYPVPFFLDGAMIMQSLKPSRGYALEVVYPGPLWQHGFYRDDNPERQQKSIIDHVVGHNVFAYSSGLQHYRAGQGMVASQKLGELLENLYHSYNKDEVQRFYLWAQTLTGLYDWSTPLYEDPKVFEPKLKINEHDALGRRVASIARHPQHETENLLAAFAANIASWQPGWKREILELLNISRAFQPALIHTQVMNEGFASIMQEILAENSDINLYPEFLFDSTRVMQSEHHPNLQDPYSLGVFCWRHLRQKFHARPEHKDQPLVVKDREFLKYAVEEVIGRMVDDEFLRYAFDQELVDRHRLGVIRKAQGEEFDWTRPRPPSDQPLTQYTITSRNVDKVVQSINEMVLKPKYIYRPRVRLVDFKRPATGEVELVLDDDYGSKWPLRRTSLAPALFALANIIDAPISLEASLVDDAKPAERDDVIIGPFFPRPPPPPPKLMRARIVVSPSLDVRVFRLNADEKYQNVARFPGDPERMTTPEKLDKELTLELEKSLKGYIEDLFLDDPAGEDAMLRHSPKMRDFVGVQMASQINQANVEGVVSHAPGAAAALMEYQRVVQSRMLAALERSMKLGRGIHAGKNGMRVKALPSVMRIEFDERYVQQWTEAQPPEPVDNIKRINRTFEWKKEDPEGRGEFFGAAFGRDEGVPAVVTPIDGNPGDIVWGPDNPPGGGPGDPDDGDDQGDNPGGIKPGDREVDPSWVDIPPDLYAKFLGENVTLPFLNKKPGESKVRITKQGKKRTQRHGHLLLEDTARKAMERGIEVMLDRGLEPDDDPTLTLDAGFAHMLPRDWRVRGIKPAFNKETKAVVTFIRDASYSTARYNDAFKRVVTDIQTLIAMKYKGFAFRYVTFSMNAKLVGTLQEFLKMEFGGGTNHEAGLVKAHEDWKANYPRSVWDRFTFLLGDMEDMDQPAMKRIEEMLEDSEYFGTIMGLNGQGGGWPGGLQTAITNKTRNTANMGMTILNPDGTYTIDHLRELLQNEPEPAN